MIASIRDLAGQGNAAIYVRLRNVAGAFWDFAASTWVGSETTDCKTFLAERADSGTDSRYMASITPPAVDSVVEYIRVADASVLGEDIIQPQGVDAALSSAIVVAPVAGTLRSNALATISDFNADTGNTSTAVAARWINVASQLVENYLGGGLEGIGRQVGFVETFTRHAGEKLYLAKTPVETITSVVADGDTLDPTAYALQDLYSGELYRKGGWGLGAGWAGTWNWGWTGINTTREDQQRVILVTYTGGWVLPNSADPGGTFYRLPSDIQEAATMLASHLYQWKGKNQLAGTQQVGWKQTAGDGSDIPANITSILDRYRRFSIR